MKRRDFIKRSIPLSFMPMALNGFSMKAYTRHPILEALTGTAMETDHVLVLIQLNGGNDGLNTILPLDQYTKYYNARSNIAIPEEKVLKLTDATGIHPAMSELYGLYNDGKVAVVQSVGYPNPNFSHFRATDIWLTASDYNQYLTSGWLGRYLDEEFPGFPDGYPNASMPDPLAIQIGSVVSTAFQASSALMGIAISNPSSFYTFVEGKTEDTPNTPYGHELAFARLVIEQTDKYSDAIKAAAGKATNLSTKYPAAKSNSLADQLKIVAQLVAGGLKTRVYIVNLGGFDTHSNQVVTTDTVTGNHANLLNKISVAVDAFQDDVKLLGVQDRIVGMTFSEFGRRIKSNGSAGTDHGTAAPLFVFGSSVIPGVLGANPDIPDNPATNSNLTMQYDFRSVYASLLKDWFNVSDTILASVLFKDFQILPIIKTSPTTTDRPLASAIALGQNYPNPVTPALGTTIPFTSAGGRVRITVFNDMGREVQTLTDEIFPVGQHSIGFQPNTLPSGRYYYRLQSGRYQEVKSMVLVR